MFTNLSGSWTLIVHATVPLTIFYRFHSSVCLAEIWKNAYKTRAPLSSDVAIDSLPARTETSPTIYSVTESMKL